MENLLPIISQISSLKCGEVLIDIPEHTLPVICELLGIQLKKNITISVVEDFDPDFSTLNISVGSKIDMKSFDSQKLQRVQRVWNRGEISVLGDVIIVWPQSSSYPIRISMFDSVIESMAYIDPDTRRTIMSIENYMFGELEVLRNYSNQFHEGLDFCTLYMSLKRCITGIDLGIRSISGFSHMINVKSMQTLLDGYEKQGYEVLVTYQSDNFLSEYEWLNKYKSLQSKHINRGFLHMPTKKLVINESDIVGEVVLDSESKGISEDIFKKIVIGDYVVHEDHGIGVFNGIIERENGQYLAIKYAGNDLLMVPFSSSAKVTKFIGAGKKVPTITGLNSGVWTRIKSSAKHSVSLIAKELLKLYSMRNIVKAPTIISNESLLNQYLEFAKSFKHADTEDQLVITNQIAQDFSLTRPMDRLIVGDVGFGKTELAVRAAFAAINAGYQVAVLAPTTLLVSQHYRVFKDRLESYGFCIEHISRFTDDSKEEELIAQIQKGTVDVIVGTHRLLQNDIKFKNLGLLIIDEEQRFGVAQKEKLRNARLDVHTLAMSATPIPRTMNMALTGLRDLSILASAPQGRKSVHNKYSEFDWSKVISDIRTEVDRKGQVYFLHNRVRDSLNIKREIESRMPDIRVGVAHGQLNAKSMEKVMTDFINGNLDVLVCTTIIENGLDLENVNTLIVDNSSIYGLSQLYQIRGRVGRSEKQAYANFYYTSLRGDSASRLQALSESEEIGSGFIVSSKDLELRGAGNILGKEQSGTINAVGYAYYIQMLTAEIEKHKSAMSN